MNPLHSSESNEWYTPPWILQRVRGMMGGIYLDPASSLKANETIKAKTILTIEDDGLERAWFGDVWLNPPYGGQTAKWTQKLVEDYNKGFVTQACLLVNGVPGRKWFKPLFAYPVAFFDKRINFISASTGEEQTSPTHDSALVYVGGTAGELNRFFQDVATIVERYQ